MSDSSTRRIMAKKGFTEASVLTHQVRHRYLEVRRRSNDELIKRFDLSTRCNSEIERLERGLTRNMDLDNFYCDEFDYFEPQKEK